MKQALTRNGTVLTQILKLVCRHELESSPVEATTAWIPPQEWTALVGCLYDRSLFVDFPWAEFRTIKGAIKLHELVDHAGYLPAYVSITDGKVQ